MFAANIEVARINDAGAGSPGDYFLNLSFADLEIVIEKSSWIDRQALPALAHVLDRKIGEFDFLAKLVFHTRSVRNLLFGRGMSATDRTGKSKQTAEEKDQRRVTCHFRKFSGFSETTEAIRRS
jgi:hypothetical protein